MRALIVTGLLDQKIRRSAAVRSTPAKNIRRRLVRRCEWQWSEICNAVYHRLRIEGGRLCPRAAKARDAKTPLPGLLRMPAMQR